ncbi:GNAT family protein [Undibacterium sp.]|jgi:ribosomal-protein-alanine N-acetyltransferase|uniref:GNAT family N-acetyltransferase n=1 Tax=Undibacterium sp. TaxID=1914977 RepID=UPI002CD39133|nr:GNAT family protein [Undibacterium sp.]HTD04350.1 GNAT family protein [Undibacterium sp.]
MQIFPELATPRLQLRELGNGDVDALFAIHSNAAAMQWFGADAMTERRQAMQLVETFANWRLAPNPGIRWGIQRHDTGQLIGTCGLFKWNRSWHSCTVGYELAEQAWGQGYMREALQHIITWGFSEMQLNRIEAQINPENRASWRLAEKLGFRHEGTLLEAGYWNDKFHDLRHYALLKKIYYSC